MINVDEVINDTLIAFKTSKDKLSSLPKINESQYRTLHTYPLVPLKLKINTEDFLTEIDKFDFAFEQWGNRHNHLPRFGAALVNKTGTIIKNDPINRSLVEWNLENPNDSLIETDCCISTDLLSLPSLSPLKIFDGHWCRSNILKWQAGAKFLPHIDTVLPAPWFRLWGTTSSTNLILRFYLKDGTVIQPKIESGRIYIIDTSLVHDAECIKDINYQFFLSVLPGAINILEKEILNG